MSAAARPHRGRRPDGPGPRWQIQRRSRDSGGADSARSPRWPVLPNAPHRGGAGRWPDGFSAVGGGGDEAVARGAAGRDGAVRAHGSLSAGARAGHARERLRSCAPRTTSVGTTTCGSLSSIRSRIGERADNAASARVTVIGEVQSGHGKPFMGRIAQPAQQLPDEATGCRVDNRSHQHQAGIPAGAPYDGIDDHLTAERPAEKHHLLVPGRRRPATPRARRPAPATRDPRAPRSPRNREGRRPTPRDEGRELPGTAGTPGWRLPHHEHTPPAALVRIPARPPSAGHSPSP